MAMLNLLTSDLFGFGLRKFNAPFSEKSKDLILYSCLVGSFIKDLPQFVIQVRVQQIFLKNFLIKN